MSQTCPGPSGFDPWIPSPNDLIFSLSENRLKDDDHDTEAKDGSITSEVPITETDDQIPGRLHAMILM